MFNNNINQFFRKRPSPKDREQRQEGGCLKERLERDGGSDVMQLRVSQAKAMGYKVANTSEMPSCEREDSVAFLR